MISRDMNFTIFSNQGGRAFAAGGFFAKFAAFEFNNQPAGFNLAFEELGFTVRFLENFDGAFAFNQSSQAERAPAPQGEILDLNRFTDNGGFSDKAFDAGTDGFSGFNFDGVTTFGFDDHNAGAGESGFSGADSFFGGLSGHEGLTPDLVNANIFSSNAGIFGDQPLFSPENIDFFDGNI